MGSVEGQPNGRGVRQRQARWALPLLLMLGCGGKATESRDSEPKSEPGGSASSDAGSSNVNRSGAAATAGKSSAGNDGGGGQATGGTVDLNGSGGAVAHAGTSAAPPSLCPDMHSAAPGVPVYDLAITGTGQCDRVTLGETIDAVHEKHPELADIDTLYVPDPNRGGDGSFIYAFETSQGTFDLVFKRGGGDCPAGCTENDYWYFETVSDCAIVDSGYTRRYDDGACVPPEEAPKWGVPPAVSSAALCGASTDPDDLSGDYDFYLCGDLTACTTSSQPAEVTPLPSTIHVHVEQDPAMKTSGHLVISGTGDPWLDEREMSIVIERQSFHAEEHASNLPSMCPETHDFTFDYDFEGFGPRRLRLLNVATPDCGKPDDYCKGGLAADLGPQLHGTIE